MKNKETGHVTIPLREWDNIQAEIKTLKAALDNKFKEVLIHDCSHYDSFINIRYHYVLERDRFIKELAESNHTLYKRVQELRNELDERKEKKRFLFW